MINISNWWVSYNSAELTNFTKTYKINILVSFLERKVFTTDAQIDLEIGKVSSDVGD